MPKNNKNKTSAFHNFMLEWMKNEEKKGRKFPNGLKDVQIDPVCNKKWRNMSEQDKTHYKDMQKKSKEQPNINKRTCNGDSLSDLDRVYEKERNFRIGMIQYILSLVNMAHERKCLKTLEFYVIHVNFFYSRTMDDKQIEYYPAEIVIAEFSLEKGVKRVYHQIVNKKVKIGFTSAAKEQSENTHHIPIDAPFGKSNYQEIIKDIYKFLEPGTKKGKLPPLYTLYKNDEHIPAKSVLSRLLIADQKPDDRVLLYSLEDLFASIHKVIIEQEDAKMEPIAAAIELQRDTFAHILGLECEVHGKLQAGLLYCSQSIVKRWIFIICSYCCDQLGITMIPGIHMPSEDVRLAISAFGSMSLNEITSNSTQSITGVSSDYKIRASERTVEDKQRRKAEASLRPIEIIEHSKTIRTMEVI